MINPLTQEPIGKGAIQSTLIDLFGARRAAKKQARSGHPGRRAEANRALVSIDGQVRRLYRRHRGW